MMTLRSESDRRAVRNLVKASRNANGIAILLKKLGATGDKWIEHRDFCMKHARIIANEPA